MAFGLTPEGFNKKTLADVLETINNATTAAFGSPNVAPDSVFGQFNGIMAEIASDLWDLMDVVYASQYALSATGLSLDAVAELNNLKRLAATPSFVNVLLEGDNLTVVPLGTQFKQSNTTEIFETLTVVTLDTSNVLKAVFSVNDPGQVPPHTITITKDVDGLPVLDVFQNLESTELAILTDFRNQINGIFPQTQEAVLDEDNLILTITNLDLANESSFGVVWDVSMTLDEQWTPVPVRAVNVGTIPIPANSIQEIESTVAGLDEVDNLVAGTTGTDIETDDAFRIRRKLQLNVLGAASVPAMESRLVNDILSVTSASIITNRTSITDVITQLPPHSFQAIVSGGTDQEVGDLLWQIKSAGIETFGGIPSGVFPAVTVDVIDSLGAIQKIHFSRPIIKYIHFNITITLYDEEIFPTDGITLIKQALVDFGNTLNAGDDIIRQRFFTSIYTIPGVKNITLFECSITENAVDNPATIVSSGNTITLSPDSRVYDVAGGTILTDGAVSGMVVVDTSDPLILSSVTRIPLETQFIAEADIFSVTDTVDIGGFGAVDIGVSPNEIGNYDVTHIAITIA